MLQIDTREKTSMVVRGPDHKLEAIRRYLEGTGILAYHSLGVLVANCPEGREEAPLISLEAAINVALGNE